MKAKTDFSKLPVGTKVWSSVNGHCVIQKTTNNPHKDYPILCMFNEGKLYSYFTPDGKKDLSDVYPTLFLKTLPGFEDGTAFESEVIDERIGKKCRNDMKNVESTDYFGDKIRVGDMVVFMQVKYRNLIKGTIKSIGQKGGLTIQFKVYDRVE